MDKNIIHLAQDFRNYWRLKGSEFGKCHTLRDSPWFWINIPKNASSFTQTLLAHQLLWSSHNYFDLDTKGKTPFVVLRDPVERWISGIAEYVRLYHKNFNANDVNKQMLDWIFDRVAFDDHTDAQIYFIQGIDLKKTIWFKCNSDYENKLVKWMISVGLLQPGFQIPDYVREFDNITALDQDQQTIKTYFHQVVLNNPEYRGALEKYFEPDYNLIKQIDFQ